MLVSSQEGFEGFYCGICRAAVVAGEVDLLAVYVDGVDTVVGMGFPSEGQ